MKKSIETVSETDDDLNELDKLVTQEIDALQLKSKKKVRITKAQKRKIPLSDNVIFQQDWSKQNEATEQNQHVLREYETDNINERQDEDLENDVGFIEEDAKTALATTAELFTEEEQDFILRATDWLAARDNKDLIMTRIWEQITESVPESFYSVEQESRFETEHLQHIEPHVPDNTDSNPSEPST